MEKSATIGKLATALNQFQQEVGNVKKDGENPFFHSKFATFESLVKTVKAPLAKAGLSYAQFPSGENELVTILLHVSGEYIQDSVKMTPKDNTPQGQGSAITYMRRYSLGSVLGIATEEDDDGNAASQPKSSKPIYEKSKPVNKTVIPVKENPLKREIKTLCDELNPTLKKGEYEKFVETETGLILVEQNYTGIIKKLKEKVEVQKEVQKDVDNLV